VNSTVRKILIIRLSSLGDVLLTTPIIGYLSDRYNSPEIHYLVKSQFTDAVKFHPALKKLIIFDKNDVVQLKNEIACEKYDFIIDLQNNLRTRRLTRGIQTKIFRFKKRHLKKFLLVHLKINFLMSKNSIPELYAETIGAAKDIINYPARIYLPEGKSSPKIQRRIGLCPGAQHFTKRWPEKYFSRLSTLLLNAGFSVSFLGGKSDIPIIRELTGRISGTIDASTDNNFIELCRNMVECEVVVTNDSGLMHTAAALGIPVLAIFGSTVREFGFFPFNIRSEIIENNKLTCRPCSHIGRKSCPKKHFNCMEELSADLVFYRFENFYNSL